MDLSSATEDGFLNSTYSEPVSFQDSTEKSRESQVEKLLVGGTELTSLIFRWVSMPLFLVGVLGNLLVVCVLSTKKMRAAPLCLTLGVLVAMDTGKLVTGLLRRWISAMYQFDIRSASLASCRIQTFLQYWFSSMSVVSILLITIERYIVIAFPLKSGREQRKKHLLCSLILGGLVAFLAHCHFLWTTELAFGRCRMTSQEASRNYVRWAVAVLNCYVSIPLLFIFNILISRTMYAARKMRQSLTEAPEQQESRFSLTGTLLAISITHLLLTAPMQLWWTVIKPLGNATIQEAHKVVWPIVVLMSYTNNALNILLYTLFGSKFRDAMGPRSGIKQSDTNAISGQRTSTDDSKGNSTIVSEL